MYKKISLSLLCFCIILFGSLYGQQFGGNSSSIHWRQIVTKPVRIIFPQGEDSVAQRIAGIINTLDSNSINSLGPKRKRINLVLQDRTTISNAYVGLGPFRSEFFLTPDQNSFEEGSIPWPDQLASHEFRHVQQYNNFNVGLSSVFKSLFGQEGQALANDASIPNWFFEGDAVYNETSVSKQGRGRLPYFFKDYRSLWLAGKNYSYMKLRNGSYKDFVPDHYALGYLLVAYGYQKYGDSFWKKVTHDAASFKGILYPFQRALKKYTGVSFDQFKTDAFTYFKKSLSVDNTISVGVKGNYQDQRYPHLLEDSGMTYLNGSFSTIPYFAIFQNNQQKKIRTTDLSLDGYYSQNNGKIVYASYQYDIRWGYTDYSDLKLLDIFSGKQETITHHTKYFSPDLNNDASKIVAVRVTKGSNSALDIIDIKSRQVKELPNKDHYYFTYPKFINENEILSAIRDDVGRMALSIINVSSGINKLITPLTYNVMGFPVIQNDTIYFSCSYGTTDQLMAISKDRQIFKLLNKNHIEQNGYYYPSVRGKRIAYSTFTSQGFRIINDHLDAFSWIPVLPEDFKNVVTNFRIQSLETKSGILTSLDKQLFPISDYHKATHLFNFHSIEPDVNDPVYTLNIIGENVLNSLQSTISLSYDRNEGYKKGALGLTYAGLFPYLSAGISYTIDRAALIRNKLIHWNDAEFYTGFNVPLNLSKGRSITFTNFGSQYVYNQSIFQQGVLPHQISYSYLNHFISISNQVASAKQNIYPRFAQSLTLKYQSAITNYSGYQLVGNANIYFPGFLKNHSIVINGAFLNQDTLHQIGFSSGFPFSRGYNAYNFHRMIKFGVNYNLPLFYPDAGFANIIYLSRVRANLFYDHTFVNDFNINHLPVSGTFRSLGTEITIDSKWFNQAKISFGIRYSYLLDQLNSPNRVELVLPINIFHNN